MKDKQENLDELNQENKTGQTPKMGDETKEKKQEIKEIFLKNREIQTEKEVTIEEELYPKQEDALINKMIIWGDAKNKYEALSLISEHKKLIIARKKQDFNPEGIPHFLYNYKLEGPYDTWYIIQDINNEAKKEIPLLIEKDAEIKQFIKLLQEKGIPKIDFAQTLHKEHFLNLSNFDYNEDLFKDLKLLFEEIKKDTKRLALLIYAIKDKFPQLWFWFEWDIIPFRVSQQIKGQYPKEWRSYPKEWRTKKQEKEVWNFDLSSKEESFNLTNDEERFNRVMWKKVKYQTSPNCDSTGKRTDHYFSRVFFDYNDEKAHTIDIKDNEKIPRPWTNYAKSHMIWNIIFDICLLTAVHGEEYFKVFAENLEESTKNVQESSNGYLKDIWIKQLFKEKYNEAKETMPWVFSILKGYSPESLNNIDVDMEHKSLTYIDERSERWASGGIGRYSQVVLRIDGREYKKEFQYRDKFNGVNDKYQYNFEKVKIISIEENEYKLIIKINAIPHDSKYGWEIVTFKVNKWLTKKLL